MHPVGDQGVVAGRVGERFGRQTQPRRVGHAVPTAHLFDHRVVVGGVDDDGDARVVLRGGADERRSADVDEFDQVGFGTSAAAQTLFERVQVHDDEVEQLDAVRLDLLRVVGVVGGQDSAMDLRMERLHPAVEDLWKARDAGDVGHVHALVAKRLGGPAGAHDFDVEVQKGARKRRQAGLFADGQQCPTPPTHSYYPPFIPDL